MTTHVYDNANGLRKNPSTEAAGKWAYSVLRQDDLSGFEFEVDYTTPSGFGIVRGRRKTGK